MYTFLSVHKYVHYPTYFFFKTYIFPLKALLIFDNRSFLQNLQIIFDFYSKLQQNITPSSDELMFSRFYLGYVFVDSQWLVKSKRMDNIRAAHHLMVVVCHCLVIFQKRHAWNAGFCMGIVEISSVLLNTRGFIKFHSFFQPIKLKFNVFFAMVFFFFRIFIYILAGLFLILSPHTQNDAYLWWFCAFSMNVLFFHQILDHIRKETKERSLIMAFIKKTSPLPYFKLSVLRQLKVLVYDLINRGLFFVLRFLNFNKGIDFVF